MFTWHIVSDEVGTILAVYPENELSLSQERARRIQRATGLPTYLHSIPLKPGDLAKVGQSISMNGLHFRA